MPLYHFNTEYGDERFDSSGVELPDDAAAWNEALITCGQILKDLRGTLSHSVPWEMKVTDSAGRILFTIRVMAEKFV